MDSLGTLFRLNMVGEKIRPDVFTVRHIMLVLTSVERLFSALVSPTGQKRDQPVAVALKELRWGSLSSDWVALRPEAYQAYEVLQRVVWTRTAGMLPPNAQRPLRVLEEVVRSFDSEMTLIRPESSDGESIIRLDPELHLFPRPVLVKGKTTVYGVVRRVGGEQPRAQIVLDDGRVITASFAPGKAQDLARSLAARLYERVGVEGHAVWRSPEYQIIDFVIESLLPYRKTSLSEALRALAEAAGPHAWEGDDAAEALQLLREDS